MIKKAIRVFNSIASKLSAPLLVRLGSAGMGLLITVLISRNFGADVLGVVGLTNKIFQVILMVSLLGFRELIIRQSSIFYSQNRLQDIAGLLSNAAVWGGATSLLIMVSLYFSIDWFSINVFEEPRLNSFLGIFVFALPFGVISKYVSFVLIGIKRVTKSLLIDGFVSNAVIILALLIIYFMRIGVSTEQLALVYISSRILSVIIALGFFRELKIYLREFRYDRSLIREGGSFFGLSMVNVMSANLDVIIVGAYFDTEQVGIYVVASTLALLLKLIMNVIDYLLAPEVAQLFAHKKYKQLKLKIRQFVAFGLLITLTFFLTQLFFGSQILSIWGTGFQIGHEVLIALSVGIGIEFTTSPYSTLFKMSGKQSLLLKVQFWTAVGYVILLILLAMNYGLLEAAIAFVVYRAAAGILLVLYGSHFLNRLQVQ